MTGPAVVDLDNLDPVCGHGWKAWQRPDRCSFAATGKPSAPSRTPAQFSRAPSSPPLRPTLRPAQRPARGHQSPRYDDAPQQSCTRPTAPILRPGLGRPRLPRRTRHRRCRTHLCPQPSAHPPLDPSFPTRGNHRHRDPRPRARPRHPRPRRSLARRGRPRLPTTETTRAGGQERPDLSRRPCEPGTRRRSAAYHPLNPDTSLDISTPSPAPEADPAGSRSSLPVDCHTERLEVCHVLQAA